MDYTASLVIINGPGGRLDKLEILSSISKRFHCRHTKEYDLIPTGRRTFAEGGLRQRAEDILQDLVGDSKLGLDKDVSTKHETLIFLGYGLGGLLVKQILLSAATSSRYKTVSQSTDLLVFLGTPHRTKSTVSSAQSIFRMLSTPKLSEIDPVSLLVEFQSALPSLEKDFHIASGNYDIVNLEAGRMGDNTDVTLDEYCSTMGIPGERNIQVACTHAELCASAIGGQIGVIILEKVERALEAKRKVNLSSRCHEFLKRLGEYTAAVLSPSWTWTQLSASGSMDWIQATESFQGWKSSPGSSVLHMDGQPGSGTTVLSSHLISLLRADANANTVLATFTAAVQTIGTCQVTDMLVALSQQLLSREPDAFQGCTFLCSWIMSLPKVFITEAIAWSLLRNIVSAIRDPVYFIIRHFDLLGPTPGWEHALVKLSQIGKPGQPLRILVTTTRPLTSTAPGNNRTNPKDPGECWKHFSRAYTDSNPSSSLDLPVGYFNISLENRQDMSSAIETAVRERIDLCSQESKLWSELGEEVVTKICVPGTTYLLATQQIDYIRSSLFHATKSNLRRGLKELPLTQDAIYTRTLEPLSEQRRDWAMVALAWIAFSIRQLDDRELALALAFESGVVGDVQALRENISYDIASDLAKVIGPFFKIVGSQLYPIHRTIRSMTDLSNYAARFHAKATITCLKYLSIILSHEDIIKPKGELSDEVSKRTDCVFLSYSVIHWPDHYQSALSGHDDGDLMNRIYGLLEKPHLLERWSKLYAIFTRSGVWEEPTVSLSSGLNVACRFGLISLAKAYSVGRKGSFFVGKVGADALDLAAQFGHAAVVSWLRENGATSPNALSLAAAGGHADIVGDLFKNGFDPSRKDEAGYTPVLHAAERGHLEVLNGLLEGGGKELFKGTAPDGSTALHFASRIGHSEAVQKLLLEGADGMQEDTFGQIPLHLAAAGGYTDVIVALKPEPESLIKKTTTNDGGDTPLHLAALSGNSKACQALLSVGSLPLLRIRNKKEWTPLHLASDSGHLDVVRLFLAHLDKANIQKQAEETSREEASKEEAKEESQAPQLNPATVNLDELPAVLAAGNGHVTVMMELLNHLAKERHGKDSTFSINNFRGLDEAYSCLRIAAGNGQVDALKQLLQADVDVSSPDPIGNTALQLAVKNNHLSAIEELLQQASSEDKNAALTLAVSSGNTNITLKLIGNGTEVTTNSSGVSPLHAAAEKGNKVIMSELLKTETGAKLFPDVIDDLVSLAAINGHTAVVEDLFRRNKEACESEDSKEYDERFFGRLLKGIPAWDNPDAFRTLLEAGFPSSINPSPEAPLHVAAERGLDAIIDLLVANGATIDQRTDDGKTALMIATINGNVSTCECLLGHGADANSTDTDQDTPLIIACRAGSKDLAKLLLDHNGNIHAANSRGVTPLHAAIEAPELMRFLLGRSPKPNMEVPGADERTPLLEAAMKGNVESADLLLKENASIAANDDEGRTCLHLALRSRHLDVVELLVKNSLDCNARDDDNFTPLHHAAISGFPKGVEYLIPRIADINAISGSGTALAVTALGAYAENREECIRCADILISNKANVNCYGGDLHSPLQTAAWYEIPELVKLFLSKGAEVEARGGWFTNALNAAVECNRVDITEMLMGAGASPTVVLNDGQTILSRAIANSTMEVVEALLHPCGQDVSQEAIDEAARTAVKYDKLSLFKSLLFNKNVSTGAKGADLPPILFDAISSSGDEVLYFLLDEGKKHIDINETDAHGMTALAYAVTGDYYYLDELLDAGANPNIADKIGNTPLIYAAKAGNEEFVRILLRNAARLDALDFAGRGALYWACYFRNESLFNTLMDSLDTESTKMNCNSAIHAAAARSMREMLGELLEAGADPLYRDRNNWSIVDTVKEYDDSETLEELLPLIESSPPPPPETENSPSQLAALKHPTVWNKLDVYKEVEISDDGLKVTLKVSANSPKRREPAWMARSDFCMPADTYVYYFEVTIEKLLLRDGEDEPPEFSVGFCEEHVSLSRMVGWDNGAWGYHSDNGQKYKETNYGSSYSDTYAEGATIGCGVNFHDHTAFFTKDGTPLGEAFSGIRGKLYPAVSFGRNLATGSCVSVNFGNNPEIKFKFSPPSRPANDNLLKPETEPSPGLRRTSTKPKKAKKSKRRESVSTAE